MIRPQAAGYVRVSTDRQQEEGASIQDQKAHIERFAASKGIEVVRYYEDAHTATEDTRPSFQEMLCHATDPSHPYDYILVYHTSRFARNNTQRVLNERLLQRHNVKVVSATLALEGSDAQIELLKNFMGSIDEFYSKLNSENTTRCMKANARDGYRRPPDFE